MCCGVGWVKISTTKNTAATDLKRCTFAWILKTVVWAPHLFQNIWKRRPCLVSTLFILLTILTILPINENSSSALGFVNLISPIQLQSPQISISNMIDIQRLVGIDMIDMQQLEDMHYAPGWNKHDRYEAAGTHINVLRFGCWGSCVAAQWLPGWSPSSASSSLSASSASSPSPSTPPSFSEFPSWWSMMIDHN